MKIGTKQIVLLVVAVTLLTVGYKHKELANLWKGNNVVESTPTPSEEAEDVFAGVQLPFDSNRLNRDSARAKTKETYQAIVKDTTASDTTVTEAYNHIIMLAQQAEKETKIEGLLREKGFADAYVCFSDLGEIDVLIKADTLTELQVTQIADIVVRHTGLDYFAIHVRKVA